MFAAWVPARGVATYHHRMRMVSCCVCGVTARPGPYGLPWRWEWYSGWGGKHNDPVCMVCVKAALDEIAAAMQPRR